MKRQHNIRVNQKRHRRHSVNQGSKSYRLTVGEQQSSDDSDDQNDYQRNILKKGITSLKKVYIERFHCSPLLMRISLVKHGKFEQSAMTDGAFYKTITNLGLSITSLENAPLRVNAFEIQQVYGDKSEITEQFKGYYKQQIKRNVLSFVGASNLLGNPVGFMDQVGTGFKDFYYQPAEGY
jgi:vacuolar protein sorting-associated protein 13A/C